MSTLPFAHTLLRGFSLIAAGQVASGNGLAGQIKVGKFERYFKLYSPLNTFPPDRGAASSGLKARARRPGHSQRDGCDESLRGICNRLQTATNWGKISK